MATTVAGVTGAAGQAAVAEVSQTRRRLLQLPWVWAKTGQMWRCYMTRGPLQLVWLAVMAPVGESGMVRTPPSC